MKEGKGRSPPKRCKLRSIFISVVAQRSGQLRERHGCKVSATVN